MRARLRRLRDDDVGRKASDRSPDLPAEASILEVPRGEDEELAANVRIDSLSEGWYAARYDGAKRIVGGPLGSSVGLASTMSFTTSGGSAFTTGGGSAFTSDVVYFTH